MNASTQQIVNLTKQGFTPEQIATALGMRAEDVLMVVAKDTQAIAKIATTESLDNRFKSLADQAIDVLWQIAQSGETDHVRAQCAKYIADQATGRFKPRERATITNNYAFIVDRASAAKAKALNDTRPIEV